MEATREEKIEALQTLMEFNPKVIHNINLKHNYILKFL